MKYDMRISKAVKDKTKYSLKAYCEINELSYLSLRKGYISDKAKARFAADGIVIEPKAA